ncbi:transporter [Clostridia bacterium]|nr:transporter [Clostridia bacterium]
MFSEALNKIAQNSRVKADLSKKQPLRYMVLGVLAGLYIGLAVFLIFAIGAPIDKAGWPVAKFVMGASFSIALTLVVFAGSELTTGNVLFMGVGVLRGDVSLRDAGRVLGYSFVGNAAGTFLMACFVYASGLLDNETTSSFIISSAAAKIAPPPVNLIFRGLLCNMCVCLALWMGNRVREELIKVVFIAQCLFVFTASGFDHCVANMFLISAALFADNTGLIQMSGYIYNISLVSVGHLFGGMLVAAPYVFLTPKKG